MGKLKPSWMKTDIPKDTKIKLWRIMMGNPTYKTWLLCIAKNPEVFDKDEKDYVSTSRDTYKLLQDEIKEMPLYEVLTLPEDIQNWIVGLRPELEVVRERPLELHQRKEHSNQLADIARILLENGLDTLTTAQPQENQKDEPNLIAYFEKYPYKIYNYNRDEVLIGDKRKFATEMEQNIETAQYRYKYDLDAFNNFLSHLKAEPGIDGRELFNVIDNNPLQLVEVLNLMAKKRFKSTCPVCQYWQ